MIPKNNLAPLPIDWHEGIALQCASNEVLGRFKVACMVNIACQVYGWLLYGPPPLPEILQPDTDATLWLGSGFVWVAPGPINGDREVMLIAGDDPTLHIREVEDERWQPIPCDLQSLCEVLDRWTDELVEVAP